MNHPLNLTGESGRADPVFISVPVKDTVKQHAPVTRTRPIHPHRSSRVRFSERNSARPMPPAHCSITHHTTSPPAPPKSQAVPRIRNRSFAHPFTPPSTPPTPPPYTPPAAP